MPSSFGQFSHLGCEFLEGGLDFGRQRLPQDLSVLGFGRSPMAGGAPFEPTD
jgi:hypothetical protein